MDTQRDNNHLFIQSTPNLITDTNECNKCSFFHSCGGFLGDCIKNRTQIILSTLTGREEYVLKQRCGLKEGRAYSKYNLGKLIDMSEELISQISAKACRKLRHPIRARWLDTHDNWVNIIGCKNFDSIKNKEFSYFNLYLLAYRFNGRFINHNNCFFLKDYLLESIDNKVLFYSFIDAISFPS